MDQSTRPHELLLLEYGRLSDLLNNAAFWDKPGALKSILLIARNGSVLAHAYSELPSTRSMRSDATAFSATYTAYMNTAPASVSQGVTRSSAEEATIITSIAANLLLAVSGSVPSESSQSDASTSTSSLTSASNEHAAVGNFPQHELDTLISISDELTSILRDQLSEMHWPEDF